MRTRFLDRTLPLILIAACLTGGQLVPAHAGSGWFDPPGILLTWQRDPTTTMTIDWHTEAGMTASSIVEYRGLGEDLWSRRVGTRRAFPYSDRSIHRVELTGLNPGAHYEFRFGEGGRTAGLESRVFRFRTMPADAAEPVRFAIGGDTRHRQDWMERTNRQAMRFDPEFIAWGGDLAYGDGREDRLYRWYEWFDAIRNTLIAEDGRVVPVVVGIGNHEVLGGYYERHEEFVPSDDWRVRIAPYFYTLFAFPAQPGYNVLDFGSYMTLIALDTAHTNPIGGAQTEWLQGVLEARKDVPHVFPFYHIPAYPSHRSYDATNSELIRRHWVPLFELHGVRVAFENHDHTYKRTHPIRNGQVDDRGVVYLGDGAWGVGIREVHPVEETWYLARAESARHLILVTIQGRHRHFTTIDEDGNVIDRYPGGRAAGVNPAEEN